jgi:beta-ribofuranosylaminobenzene 5'-phosphate synthase
LKDHEGLTVMKLFITTPCRVHATLIDMNGAIGRVDGGIGLTLENPGWRISFERDVGGSTQVKIPGSVGGNYVDMLVADILNHFGLDPSRAGIKIEVHDVIPRHVGLGSKTQLALALADGISRLLVIHGTPLSKELLASVVKRGGTSGIGVTSYFTGGFILDGGHEFGKGKEKNSFLPSSTSNASPAPILYRQDLPDEWRVVIGIPAFDQGAHDAEEVYIFKTCCPVSLQDVQKISHLVLMKLLPAIKQRKFMEICECINSFQDIGFKKVEVDMRGDAYRHLLRSWRDAGAPCAGMSSFGPAVYSFAENDDHAVEIKNALDNIMKGTGGKSFITKIQNTGATIRYIT